MNTEYCFEHSNKARYDAELRRLVREQGYSAKAIYWDLMELLHEEGARMLIEDAIDAIAFDNHIDDKTLIRNVINSKGLFLCEDGYFHSPNLAIQVFAQSQNVSNNLNSDIKPLQSLADYKESLRMMPYNDFLQTPYWKDVSKAVKKRAGYKCEFCGSKTRLEVHHLTYEHKGDEKNHLDDLMCLCHTCHNKLHQDNNEKDLDFGE